MKKSILLIFILFSPFLQAKKKDDFEKRVKSEVHRQIDLIKKKSLAQLTKELLEKERKLAEKEAELTNQKELLERDRETFFKKINSIEKQTKKIIGCDQENKERKNMRIRQMVSVVSNMKPQKAANLLSVQDSDISVKIIEKIDPTKASKIFNLMDKEVSARLQKQYLSMRQ